MPDTQIFVTAATLARKVNMPMSTLARRLKALRVKPDGMAIQGCKSPCALFRVERLAEIRRAVAPVITAED